VPFSDDNRWKSSGPIHDRARGIFTDFIAAGFWDEITAPPPRHLPPPPSGTLRSLSTITLGQRARRIHTHINTRRTSRTRTTKIVNSFIRLGERNELHKTQYKRLHAKYITRVLINTHRQVPYNGCGVHINTSTG